MSPKIVNGSFAAIFDSDEFLEKSYAGIRIAVRLNYLQTAVLFKKSHYPLCYFNIESEFASYASSGSRNSNVR